MKIVALVVAVIVACVGLTHQSTVRVCGHSLQGVYHFSTSPARSFRHAQAFCQRLYGRLAIITSGTENNFIGSQAALRSPNVTRWYIDHDASYNNYDSTDRTDRGRCTVMDTTKWYTWTNVECGRTQNFVCEINADAYWVSHGEHDYLFVVGVLSQSEAEEFCQAVGEHPEAHLVWVEDKDEMAWLRATLQQTYPRHRYWYIGLKDVIGDNQHEDYHWSSGAPVTYMDFAKDEPHYHFERCITVEYPSRFSFHDVNCERTQSFICKRPST